MSNGEEPLVRVEHVSKKYCRSLKRSLWYGLRDLGGELLGRSGDDRLALRKDEFLAVDDVSFELRRGDCLGLIGANGAGKSTLLKMLNGLVRPDAGRIEIRGRVGALIELGAGFNPILTGRENVYVNGAVLGMSKKEIDARFDEIVEFAELKEFIDTPVQSYSSGMRVRLGFAVAAHLEPDVLLIDEVLAVGDASFRMRCIAHIAAMAPMTAIVFVSHQLSVISRVSNRLVFLSRGRMEYSGDNVSTGLGMYIARLSSPAPEKMEFGYFDLVSVTLRSGSSATHSDLGLESGAELVVEVEGRFTAPVDRWYVKLALTDSESQVALECDSRRDGFRHRATDPRLSFRARIPSLQLNNGRYVLSIHLVEARPDGSPGRVLHVERNCAQVNVSDRIHNFTPYQPRAEWSWK